VDKNQGNRAVVKRMKIFRRKEGQVWQNVERVIVNLSVMNNKLSSRIQYMTGRGRELFEACVKAQAEGDQEKATMYASELSQMRKTLNNVIRSQLSLEAVINRLSTLKDLKDVKEAIAPVKAIVSNISKDVHGAMPELGMNIRAVQESLEDISVEIGGLSGNETVYHSVSDDEVRKILEEAAEIAARRTKEAVPDITR
jgi:division protein CdvB (Snf7/Vps24/ESCRT-III family)